MNLNNKNYVIRSNFIFFFFLALIFNVAITSYPKIGECMGNCENGVGNFKFEKSLDEYDGNFLDGKFHGYGLLKIYKGKNKKENLFDTYEGMFSGDQMEGEGIYRYANGDTLLGNFSNNKLNGVGSAQSGTINKNKGYYYTGMFSENKFHGFGIYKYTDGSFYAGEFSEGKMSGLGFMKNGKLIKFINGYDSSGKPSYSMIYNISSDEYISYSKDKTKKESLLKKDGYLYGGNLEEDTPKGIGFSKEENGKIYYGEWKEGKSTGTGLFLNPNGILYIGRFEQKKLNGFGLKFDRDGDLVYAGDWENGKRKK
jgi:hypothetical protein